MLKLKKLYSLINRNATIKLVNEKHTDVYFCGTVKDIFTGWNHNVWL